MNKGGLGVFFACLFAFPFRVFIFFSPTKCRM
jgi:hypothetical protein